ncbi:MAG: hypothetical protein OEM97_06180 [Acidimicrobiia bacterium]|nr:hypothetical protein [Acidimicrobiia bacterium]
MPGSLDFVVDGDAVPAVAELEGGAEVTVVPATSVPDVVDVVAGDVAVAPVVD